MAKPIKLTRALIDRYTADFAGQLGSMKLPDGKLVFARELVYDDTPRAVLRFATPAYMKMMALVHHYQSEVGWQGVVRRDDDGSFVVSDILVYPQTVDGANVNTDQEAFEAWLMSLDDDTANALHMQGHSHVNMSTHPSAVDTENWAKIMAQIPDDGFFVFLIWNKRAERYARIYDMANNILYETEDIDILVDGNFNIASFIGKADALVRQRPVKGGKVKKTSSNDASFDRYAAVSGGHYRESF